MVLSYGELPGRKYDKRQHQRSKPKTIQRTKTTSGNFQVRVKSNTGRVNVKVKYTVTPAIWVWSIHVAVNTIEQHVTVS